MNVVSFFYRFARFALYIRRERKRELKHAATIIEGLERYYGGTFDDATRKKIVRSHCVYNPLVIDAFCSLHGRTSTPDERKNLVYYFVCSSLLDNFFDGKELSPEQIDAICFDTGSYVPGSFDEKIFIHCHQYLLDHVTDKAGYLAVLKAEVKAQQDSMKQFQKEISSADIESIMKAKGGNAVLLCRYYLHLPVSAAEDQCWYQLGVMIQFNNDLYDIYKDMNDSIETLATRCKDAYAFGQYAGQLISLLQQMISGLPYPSAIKQHFCISAAGVCASASVGIDHLKRLQGNANQLPDFRMLERKKLIVDMEKPANIFRWLKYVYRYGRLDHQ